MGGATAAGIEGRVGEPHGASLEGEHEEGNQQTKGPWPQTGPSPEWHGRAAALEMGSWHSQ